MPDESDLPTTTLEINNLFDAVGHEKGMREAEIFRQCYEQAAHKALSQFLRDVTMCPPEVLRFCQHLLAPVKEASE